jgi:YD repeat-containing protein
MDLLGITVTDVDFQPAKLVVTMKLRSRKLRCPRCQFTAKVRYDTRPVGSSWRHLDLGRWRLEVRADLRRIDCPVHGARTEGVPFARASSHFTRDFEDLVGWLATTMDKTALRRLVRLDWDTTGRIIEWVMADGLDPTRLDNLFVIGADEVSWRKGTPTSRPCRTASRVGSSGAARAKTPPRWIVSSTNWAKSDLRRSRRCQWT